MSEPSRTSCATNRRRSIQKADEYRQNAVSRTSDHLQQPSIESSPTPTSIHHLDSALQKITAAMQTRAKMRALLDQQCDNVEISAMQKVLSIPELRAQILSELDSYSLIQSMSVCTLWHDSIIKNPRLMPPWSSLCMAPGDHFDLPNFHCSLERLTAPHAKQEPELTGHREAQNYNFTFNFGGAHADTLPRLSPRWRNMRVCEHVDPVARERHYRFPALFPIKDDLPNIAIRAECNDPQHWERSRCQPGLAGPGPAGLGSKFFILREPTTFAGLLRHVKWFLEKHEGCLENARILESAAEGQQKRDPVVTVSMESTTLWVDVIREEEGFLTKVGTKRKEIRDRKRMPEEKSYNLRSARSERG